MKQKFILSFLKTAVYDNHVSLVCSAVFVTIHNQVHSIKSTMEPTSLRISLITKTNLAMDFVQKYMHLSEKQLIQEIYIMHLCNNKQVSMLLCCQIF